MTELNKYSLYSISSDIKEPSQDKIDICISELYKINEFEEVCSFVQEFFGNIEEETLFEYPELNKQVFINSKENVIEIFIAKNKEQVFSKGWKLINTKTNSTEA